MDGIYLITFRGAADFGSGLLLLRKGQITGADLGGVLYDGEYKETPEGISINAKCTFLLVRRWCRALPSGNSL